MRKLTKLCFILTAVVCFSTSPSFSQNRLRERIRERLANKQSQSGRESPRSKKANKIALAGRDVAVWGNSNSEQPASKIVLFSHGFLGCNTQSSEIMEEIAKAGFIVFAPNHNDALCQKKEDRNITRPKFARPDQWSEESFKDRKDDLVEILEALQKDQTWSRRLDFNNVSLVGHSLGGYTVLGLAGAWPSWRMPNVRAVLGLSPYSLPFIRRKSVSGISVPSMFQGGTADSGITPSTKAKGGLYDQAGSPSYYVEFDNAGHFAFTDLNKKNNRLIKEYSIKFLKRYAAGDSSVVIAGPVPGVSDFRRK